MAEPKKAKDIDFKAGIERLEEIVENLESGEIDLEEALKVFEEGIRISRSLSEKLEKAEKQIRKLVEESDGTLTTEVMEEIEEE
ncbi:MAG: exodeoxyribonuclease VII small subunit [candidate division Zixibacteria bacterium]|nr:exodeoxyribonuclease VII small subunit [candidate division Zixibacteria bacterium]NIW41069.1 exodeoxyribonuclease VII small subunit [candidate division Zixibacteria bacterium]NIX56522.1 exodeoxyribonuclease VII small subunit [candidate division Zixibacteria bacterium]